MNREPASTINKSHDRPGGFALKLHRHFVLNQTQPKGLVHLCSARTPPALPLVEADGAGISLQNPESRALTPPCGKSAERMAHEGVPNTLPEGLRVYLE